MAPVAVPLNASWKSLASTPVTASLKVALNDTLLALVTDSRGESRRIDRTAAGASRTSSAWTSGLAQHGQGRPVRAGYGVMDCQALFNHRHHVGFGMAHPQ